MKKFVNWFEIPALDIDRAVEFYSWLFKMELKKCSYGEEEMAFFPENRLNVWGAISKAADFNPSENGIVIYFNADDTLDETLEEVVSMGGVIIRCKTKIEAEGRGSFALIGDTEGNRLGLYSA